MFLQSQLHPAFLFLFLGEGADFLPHSNNKRNPMQLIQKDFCGKKSLQNNKIAIFQGKVFRNRHLWKSLFPASCSDHSAQYLDSASLLQCIWHLASSTTTCAEQKTKSSQAVAKQTRAQVLKYKLIYVYIIYSQNWCVSKISS
jgi:hypothetical protein